MSILDYFSDTPQTSATLTTAAQTGAPNWGQTTNSLLDTGLRNLRNNFTNIFTGGDYAANQYYNEANRVARLQDELARNAGQVDEMRRQKAEELAQEQIQNNPNITLTGGGGGGAGGTVAITQSDGSTQTMSFDDLVEQVAGLFPAAPEIPNFEFDWIEAENRALEKLAPYYQELLEEVNFDMNLAIERLNQDYETGTRQLREDFDTVTSQSQQDYYRQRGYRQADAERIVNRTMEDRDTTIGQAREDFVTQREELERLEPREQRQLDETMSERGLLQSTIRDDEQTDLTGRQSARRQAINRAMQRREQVANLSSARDIRDTEREAAQRQLADDVSLGRTMEGAQQSMDRGMESLTTPYQRALEDYDIKYPRVVRDLEDEKRLKAGEMANMEYGRDFDRWYTEQAQNLGSFS